jgi:hypothetical protein
MQHYFFIVILQALTSKHIIAIVSTIIMGNLRFLYLFLYAFTCSCFGERLLRFECFITVL